jgi:hypothetical protein
LYFFNMLNLNGFYCFLMLEVCVEKSEKGCG